MNVIENNKNVNVINFETNQLHAAIDLKYIHKIIALPLITTIKEETAITSQQIEAAVRQETSAIEQIAAGMKEINTVTATLVASIKQTTLAMDDLTSISNKLKSSVETYKIQV